MLEGVVGKGTAKSVQSKLLQQPENRYSSNIFTRHKQTQKDVHVIK